MTLGESRMQFPVPPALEHPELLMYREEFPILQKRVYLNSCSLGALSKRSMQNIERFMATWSEWGASSWSETWSGEVEQARKKIATLIGAQVHEIAIASSVSEALDAISSALDYQARKNVVLTDMDFSTLAYPWRVKERLGVQCQFVKSLDRISVPGDGYASIIDEQTALVATSRVFYSSGYIQDIRAIADIAHKHGAYILVDDHQGTGQIPINVVNMDIDFLVTGTSKWLLGGPGLAFMYVREGLLPMLEPTIAGWFGQREQVELKAASLGLRRDAARIEFGLPAMAAVYAAHGGLDIVQEASVESICERSRYLTNDLIARAREQGWTVQAPPEPELRSSIVTLEIEDSQAIVKELLQRNIVTDTCAGLLRISPYFYTTLEDNAIVIDAIVEILKNNKKTD
ncbi:MAG: aminotransferase class V-fold PLP-dependent enzyme [Ktedonobacteraceae bacterium]